MVDQAHGRTQQRETPHNIQYARKRDRPQYRLQQYQLILKQRWLPALLIFSTTVLATLMTTLVKDRTHQAQGKLLIRQQQAPAIAVWPSDTDVALLALESLATQAELVRSDPVMAATIEALQLSDRQGHLLEPSQLMRRVTVDPVPDTHILQISVRSRDATEAVTIVNQVMATYREQHLASQQTGTIATQQYIEAQLPQVETDIAEAEAALRRFQETHNTILLQDEARAAVDVLASLDRDIHQATMVLADIEAQLSEIQTHLDVNVPEAIALNSLNQSPGVQTALAELQAIQADLALVRSRQQPADPQVKLLTQQQTEIEALLSDRIQEVLGQELTIPQGRLNLGRLQLSHLHQRLIAELTRLEIGRIGLEHRLAELMRTRSSYEQQLDGLPSLERTQRQLERELHAAQSIQTTLLNQRHQIQVAANQVVGSVEVIAPAQIWPSRSPSYQAAYLAGGTLAGLLLVGTTVVLLDLCDSSVKTLKDIKALYDYPLLGTLPLVQEMPQLIAKEQDLQESHPRLWIEQSDYAPVREAYQILQANLASLPSATDAKAIAVTSAIAGEGKSAVALNLAVAMAQIGRRVLLIDANMRHPSQHHALSIPNATGLSHVLTRQAALKKAVQPVLANFDVMTTGAVPPNPLALLSSKRMQTLLNTLVQHYDAVIVDAPPLTGYADALTLGKLVDGLLLVARLGMLDSTQGIRVQELLAQRQQSVLGVVANAVN